MTTAQRIIGKSSIKWIRAYLECLFDGREVFVFPTEKKQLELFLQ